MLIDRVRSMYAWAYAWRTSDCEGETDLSGLRVDQRQEFDAALAEYARTIRNRTIAEIAEAYIATHKVRPERSAVYLWMREQADVQIGGRDD